MLAATVMAACVAAAAGCGSKQAGTPASLPSQPPSSHPAHAASASAETPKQRAEADAAAILASFVPPPGARRLAKPPKLPYDVLVQPLSVLVSNSMVDKTTFWEAPGAPQAVLAWEEAHVSRRFTPGDADFGPPAWDRGFDLPSAGILITRELVVEVAGAGHGRSAIRVDAQVGWQPGRPAGERVPAAARVVTISEIPSLLPHAKRPPAPVTITDPPAVRRLAALIDGLSVSPIWNQPVSCPAPFGGLQLAFRAHPGGPVLALARTDQPCGLITFTVNGKQQPGLTNPGHIDQQILKLADLSWKLR